MLYKAFFCWYLKTHSVLQIATTLWIQNTSWLKWVKWLKWDRSNFKYVVDRFPLELKRDAKLYREPETNQIARPFGSSMAERQRFGYLCTWTYNCKQIPRYLTVPSLRSPIMQTSSYRWIHWFRESSDLIWKLLLNLSQDR